VISPSILAGCKSPSENWIPPKEFLLSLGEYDDEDESSALVAASQHTDELVTEELQSKEPLSRWSSPKCDKKLQQLRCIKARPEHFAIALRETERLR